jgi:hypothetical protein
MPITVNAITIIHWLSGVTLPTGILKLPKKYSQTLTDIPE